MKEIQLTRGKVAIVDDEDFEWLNKWKWHYNGAYARRRERGSRLANRISIYMHQQIAINYGVVPGKTLVDHIDGNKLNNRKHNLRWVNTQGNIVTRRSKKTYGYRGIYPRGSGWNARITIDYKNYNLGMFKTREEAAKAYDLVALRAWGPLAELNFPRCP